MSLVMPAMQTTAAPTNLPMSFLTAAISMQAAANVLAKPRAMAADSMHVALRRALSESTREMAGVNMACAAMRNKKVLSVAIEALAIVMAARVRWIRPRAVNIVAARIAL